MGADVNLLSVVLAAAANMVLGGLWYSPVLFARPWMVELGLSEADFEDPAKKRAATRGYVASAVGSLIAAYALALLIAATGAVTAAEGAALGFLAGIGFVATTYAAAYAFEDRSLRLYLINAMYPVASLTVMGTILTVMG